MQWKHATRGSEHVHIESHTGEFKIVYRPPKSAQHWIWVPHSCSDSPRIKVEFGHLSYIQKQHGPLLPNNQTPDTNTGFMTGQMRQRSPFVRTRLGCWDIQQCNWNIIFFQLQWASHFNTHRITSMKMTLTHFALANLSSHLATSSGETRRLDRSMYPETMTALSNQYTPTPYPSCYRVMSCSHSQDFTKMMCHGVLDEM